MEARDFSREFFTDKKITMALKIHMSSDQKAVHELKEAFGEMNVMVRETQYL